MALPRGVGQAGLVDVINDDVVIMHLQYSTQWDTLAHVGALFDADGDGKPEPIFYNGYRGGIDLVGPTDVKQAGAVPGTFVEAKSTSSANALGVENMAVKCLQGRAVMIDLFAHYGRKRHAVGYDDLMRIMAADGIKVEAGDFVCSDRLRRGDLGEATRSRTGICWRQAAPALMAAMSACSNGSRKPSWWR